MAKVEMSLSEYDALKGELDFLRRIIKEITTPVVDEWNLNYYREKHQTHNLTAKVTAEVKDYLERESMNHIPAEYDTPEFRIKPDFTSPIVVQANFVDTPTEDISEEEN